MYFSLKSHLEHSIWLLPPQKKICEVVLMLTWFSHSTMYLYFKTTCCTQKYTVFVDLKKDKWLKFNRKLSDRLNMNNLGEWVFGGALTNPVLSLLGADQFLVFTMIVGLLVFEATTELERGKREYHKLKYTMFTILTNVQSFLLNNCSTNWYKRLVNF